MTSTPENDGRLARWVARRLLDADARGTVDVGQVVVRYSRVDVAGIGDRDKFDAWIRRALPQWHERRETRTRSECRRNRERLRPAWVPYDVIEVRVPLRPKTDREEGARNDLRPTLSYAYLKPHECSSWSATVTDDEPTLWWRCTLQLCAKAMPVAEQRERGLR